MIGETLQKMKDNFHTSREIRDDFLTLKFTTDDLIKLTLIEKYKNL